MRKVFVMDTIDTPAQFMRRKYRPVEPIGEVAVTYRLLRDGVIDGLRIDPLYTRADQRPGLGLAGVANLQRFVEEGGLLIAVRSAAEFAVQYGLARHVTIEPGNEWRPGTILRAEVTDPASPVAWGYGESVPVHFAGSPLFRVGRAPFSGDDRRPSGRGSLSDPDVPQGRRFVATPPRPEAARGEKGFQLPEEMAFWIAPRIPQPEDRPRVVLAFPEKPDQLLLSGMLKGAAQLLHAKADAGLHGPQWLVQGCRDLLLSEAVEVGKLERTFLVHGQV